MTKKMSIAFIKGCIVSENEKRQLLPIYAIVSLVSLFYLAFAWKHHAGYDLYEFTGLDHLRTPVYPLIKTLSWISPITLVLQYAFYFFSIKYFFRVAKELFNSKLFVYLTALLYITHPVFLMYHNTMMTESLALSGSVIYIYLLVQCFRYYSHKNCLYYHLLVFLLIFLRPGFVYLLPISGLLFLHQIFAKQKYSLAIVFSSFLVVIMLMGAYMTALYSKYGVFAMSSVTDINTYWMLRERSLIVTDNLTNPSLKTYLDKQKNVFYPNDFSRYYWEANSIIDSYGWPALHTVVQQSLHKNFWQFIENGKRSESLHNHVGADISGDYADCIRSLAAFSINCYELMFLFLLYFILVIICFFYQKKIPWISISFLLIVLMHFVTLLLLAPNNYGRLLSPSTPIIAIMMMQLVHSFYLLTKKKISQLQLL